jgi:hypothetical protein
MPACADPPNRPTPAVINRLIDDVAWAKTCLIVSAATAPGSPERARELEHLRQAVVSPRRSVDEILEKRQAVPRNLLIELRMCELAIPKLEAGAVLRRDRHNNPTDAPVDQES